MAYLYDSFTNAATIQLNSRSPDIDASGVGYNATSGIFIYGGGGYCGPSSAGVKTSGFPKTGTLPGDNWQYDFTISLSATSANDFYQFDLIQSSSVITGCTVIVAGAGVVTLYEINTGTTTSYGTATIPSFATGTQYSLTLSVLGTTITVSGSGITPITYTSSNATRRYFRMSMRSPVSYNTKLWDHTLTQLIDQEEAISSADVISASQDAAPTQAESVTSSDVISASQDAAPKQAESVTASDSVASSSSSLFNNNQAEAISSADVISASQDAAPTQAESVTSSVAISASQDAAPKQAESVTSSSDSISVSVVSNATISETLVFSNQISAIQSVAPIASLRSFRITKWDTTTSTRIPVTGLLPVYFMFRPSDKLTLDLLDGKFKSYVGCYLPKDTMTERDVTHYPGVYDYSLASGTFGGGANGLDGIYQEYVELYSSGFNFFDEQSVQFTDGIEQLGGLNSDQQTSLNDSKGTRITEGIHTADDILRILLAFAANNGQIPSGPGAFEFHSADNGKTRIGGTVDSGNNRVNTELDGTL